MGQRRAPAGGYDFVEKEQYRDLVWSGIRQAMLCDTRRRHVLLMPSSEGAEIDAAKRHGFLEENMHIVDANPAIVATLKRRYPHINTYGVTASMACARIAASGIKLDAANFDFTSCLSTSLCTEMAGILGSGALGNRSIVGITLLRGREHPAIFQIIRHAQQTLGEDFRLRQHLAPHIVGSRPITAVDAWRIFRALMTPDFNEVTKYFDVIRCGSYLSPAAGQTMLWCLARLVDPVDTLRGLHTTKGTQRRRLAHAIELREAKVMDRVMQTHEDFCLVYATFAESTGDDVAKTVFAQGMVAARDARRLARETRGLVVPERVRRVTSAYGSIA